jgi:hypothetical protein
MISRHHSAIFSSALRAERIRMRDFVSLSANIALLWDICLRHRTLVRLLIAVSVFTFILNAVLPESFRTFQNDPNTFDVHDAVRAVNFLLLLTALLLFLSIYSQTELNPQTGTRGFPHRLFTLPLTSFHLVALPMFLGITAFEVLAVFWQSLIFREDVNAWGLMVVAAYIIAHQTILWTLPALGSLRVLVLGIVGTVFIVAFGLPSFPQEALPWWLRENYLAVWLIATAFGGFITSWIYVGRQRSGGGSGRHWTTPVVDRISDVLPRRTAPFSSAAAAHFWFEWRNSGFLLPLLVGAMLIAVIGPLSWFMRNDGGNTMRILVATLAMPMALALPVGKALSKPDWWSNDMSMPSFVAVRPLTNADFVIAKMKVAALSAAISWLLVGVFISVWLGFWAGLDTFNMLRVLLWTVYGHSVYPQYGLAILLVVTGFLLTWRFLVSSLWLGLSGNKMLFSATAIPYGFALVFVLAFVVILPRNEESVLNWMFSGFGMVLPTLVRIAAVAVVVKFWIAAWSWRDIHRIHVRQYLTLWLCGTAAFIALGLLLWAGVLQIVPSDNHQLRSLVILCALLAIPFARLGMAPGSLARNRHRA